MQKFYYYLAIDIYMLYMYNILYLFFAIINMINTSNNFWKNHVGNSNTIPGFMKKKWIMWLLLVQVLIWCNSKSTEDNKEVVPAPIEVVEPPKPVETQKPFIVNGKEIWSFLYRDNNFSWIIGLKGFNGYQEISNDSMNFNCQINYLTKDGIVYLFPAKWYIASENDIWKITELQATWIQPLTKSTALVNKWDKKHLITTTISSDGNSLSINDIGEIIQFVLLSDSTISDVQDISAFPWHLPRWGVLLAENGKKYYISEYDINHKPTEITDVKVVSVEQKKLPRTTLHLTGINNKKYALWVSRLIPYDKISQTTDGNVAYTLDGNLMSFGFDTFFGAEVDEVINAIKRGKINEYIPQNATPENDNKENSSLTDVINKKKPLPPVNEYKNISNQFIWFKVKYIGINYGGESEDYCYSSDGSNYYTFYKSQNWFYTANKVPYVDNIISTYPLSDKILRNHMFTWSYLVNPYSTLRYLGIQNGFETVEYTIRWAEWNRIQNGSEVENILIDEIIAKPEWYKPNFFYKDGAQIKKLEANTPCPQWTKIIIRYSK